jgi:hypothetical protein
MISVGATLKFLLVIVAGLYCGRTGAGGGGGGAGVGGGEDAAGGLAAGFDGVTTVGVVGAGVGEAYGFTIGKAIVPDPKLFLAAAAFAAASATAFFADAISYNIFIPPLSGW